ncbi:MAG: hypothetical protein Q8L27_02525 [archaeon]|nr:hypothetical protein [archaeon]
MKNSKSKAKLIIIGIALFLLILTTTLISGLIYQDKIKITGKTTSEETSNEVFTKALCDNNNYCRDYVYTCKNENLVSIIATEAYIQHSPNWKDLRDDNIKYKSCSS